MSAPSYRTGGREPRDRLANGSLRLHSIRHAIRDKWCLLEQAVTLSWSSDSHDMRVRTRFSNIRKKQLRCLNEKEMKRFFAALDYMVQVHMSPQTPSARSSTDSQNGKNGCCFICRNTHDLSTHHVIPREIGGTDDGRNLMSLCRPCHDTVTTITNEMQDEARRIGESPHFVDYVVLVLEIKSRLNGRGI